MFHPNQSETREDIREYVAQLQLHMALQARNLVPSLTNTRDSREKLLQDTQATRARIVSCPSVGIYLLVTAKIRPPVFWLSIL